jgi:hypothetical protein
MFSSLFVLLALRNLVKFAPPSLSQFIIEDDKLGKFESLNYEII